MWEPLIILLLLFLFSTFRSLVIVLLVLSSIQILINGDSQSTCTSWLWVPSISLLEVVVRFLKSNYIVLLWKIFNILIGIFPALNHQIWMILTRLKLLVLILWCYLSLKIILLSSWFGSYWSLNVIRFLFKTLLKRVFINNYGPILQFIHKLMVVLQNFHIVWVLLCYLCRVMSLI